MAELTDIATYAQDRIGDLLDIKGFQSVEDIQSAIEDIEDDFEGDSYCPYYAQQDEVISRYESDYGRDAEGICDSGQTYKASEWEQAKAAYAYAVASTAFSHHFSAAKEELSEGVEEFADDVARELDYKGEVLLAVNGSSSLGWAAHDRELADGTMVFTSGQLDGCNGLERQIGGVWVSAVIDPNAAPDSEDDE